MNRDTMSAMIHHVSADGVQMQKMNLPRGALPTAPNGKQSIVSDLASGSTIAA